jgi:predicted nucleotidyltransferase
VADIVDIAVSAGSFETLVTAVKAANLVDTLKSPGPFTVFAPNDEAFAKLPPETIQTLVQNIPQLTRILCYKELALFGSVLRDDFRPDSDIDVLVTFSPEAKVILRSCLYKYLFTLPKLHQ